MPRRMRIRSNVRSFWNGFVNYDGFYSMMMDSIRRGMTDAWREGAAECGLKMDELSAQERNQLEVMIFGQFDYITGFADAIDAGSKANGGKLAPLFARAERWINRYNEAKTQAAAKACANKKKVWKLGPTEHCRTCAGFEGRVYRYETWSDNGALPQSPNLECVGINCQCSLNDTDARVTAGRFPRRLLGQG